MKEINEREGTEEYEKWLNQPGITVKPPNPVNQGEKMPEGEFIGRIIQAQIGTREQADAISNHMEEYFKRWPSYRDRFTDLEWYHIFLDFSDKMADQPAAQIVSLIDKGNNSPIKEGSEIPQEIKRWIRKEEDQFPVGSAEQFGCRIGLVAMYRKMQEDSNSAIVAARNNALNCGKALQQEIDELKAQHRKVIREAYYDGFNQAHYSHVHPETFPPKECEQAADWYIAEKFAAETKAPTNE